MLGRRHRYAFCLSMLGVLAERMGRLDQAIDYQLRAAQIQHDIGDLWSEARARSNIVAYATTLWSEREISHDEALARALSRIDEPDALADVDAALALARRTGVRRDLAHALMVRAAVHRVRATRSIASICCSARIRWAA